MTIHLPEGRELYLSSPARHAAMLLRCRLGQLQKAMLIEEVQGVKDLEQVAWSQSRLAISAEFCSSDCHLAGRRQSSNVCVYADRFAARAVQWLLYNDCIFRTRNLYEYLMFHDRDEFVHFVGLQPKKVDLLSMFNQHFKEKNVAGVTYWGALYHTHCHMEEVQVLP